MRRGALAMLLALPLLTGCIANGRQAQESVIKDVAPLPSGAPGVSLTWGPPVADPVRLAPGDCATLPWALQAHALARPANVSLSLAASGGIDGLLVGQLTPENSTLAGEAASNGTSMLCAPPDAQDAEGRISLVAEAAGQTVAVSSVRIEVRSG